MPEAVFLLDWINLCAAVAYVAHAVRRTWRSWRSVDRLVVGISLDIGTSGNGLKEHKEKVPGADDEQGA